MTILTGGASTAARRAARLERLRVALAMIGAGLLEGLKCGSARVH